MRPSPRTFPAVPVVLLALGLVLAACSSSTSTSSPSSSPGGSGGSGGSASPGTTAVPATPILFSGQGNNLDAYALDPPFTTQRVDKTRDDDPNGLDLNAQICFFPDDGNKFIAGEDTNQTKGNTQGWGIFQLGGRTVGQLSIKEVGKVVPTYQGAKDNAENYGCGFLKDGRLLLTDVGNQALGPADGQLIVWFPPFGTSPPQGTDTNHYCKLDVDIATAQSIWVDPANDDVYVASARPSDEEGSTNAGVFKYSAPFPTSDTAAGGCGKKDDTGAPLADSVTKTKVIPSGDHNLISPSGIAPAPNGNLYVSSVFTGVINEYQKDGTFVRTILQPPAGEQLGEKTYSTGTPLGLAVAPDGSLFYADIGIVVAPGKDIGPGDKTGSVRKIAFVGGQPQAPVTMATDLDFPDGLGIWLPPKP